MVDDENEILSGNDPADAGEHEGSESAEGAISESNTYNNNNNNSNNNNTRNIRSRKFSKLGWGTRVDNESNISPRSTDTEAGSQRSASLASALLAPLLIRVPMWMVLMLALVLAAATNVEPARRTEQVRAAADLAAHLAEYLARVANQTARVLAAESNRALGVVGEAMVEFRGTLQATVLLGATLLGGYAYLAHVTKKRKRAFKEAASALELLSGSRGDWLLQLLGQVPNWIMFPDVEKASWLNQALEKKLWAFLGPFLCSVIQATVEPLLVSHKPLAVSSIRISEFTPGDVAPVCTGIKFLNTHVANEILLELGLTWSGNPTLKFHLTSALSGFQTVDIKVEHFQLFGTMRVGIKPLTATAPVLGNLHLSLIGRPAMDFSLSVAGGALDVMGVPGLSSFLHNFLRNTVTSLMVYPKIVEVPLHYIPVRTDPATGATHTVSREEMKQEFGVEFMSAALRSRQLTADPVGILSMLLVEAQDLEAGLELLDTTPSPFVVMSMKSDIEATVNSQVVPSTTSPSWNEHFDLLAYSDIDELNISVMDGNAWNAISNGFPRLPSFMGMLANSEAQDKTSKVKDSKQAMCLGVASYSTGRLPPHTSVPVMLELAGGRKGRIHCKLMWKPFHVPPPEAPQRIPRTPRLHDPSPFSDTESLKPTPKEVADRARAGALAPAPPSSWRTDHRNGAVNPSSGAVAITSSGHADDDMSRDADEAQGQGSEGGGGGAGGTTLGLESAAGEMTRVASQQGTLARSSSFKKSYNGLLKLKVVRGMDLVRRDGKGSILKGVMGSYSKNALCRVTIKEGTGDEELRTTTKDSHSLPGSNPHWDKDFMFFVCQPKDCTIHITVVDEYAPDKDLGSLTLKLPEVMAQAMSTAVVHNTWFLQNIQQGQLELIFEWKGPIDFLTSTTTIKKRGDFHH
mmetsp:Transcript_40617/g.76002  ORF Transcript_40617/g.76002 Transcript_40617/m.76002 type:complete len:915 (-) Transcript_40617:201-2945(-)